MVQYYLLPALGNIFLYSSRIRIRRSIFPILRQYNIFMIIYQLNVLCDNKTPTTEYSHKYKYKLLFVIVVTPFLYIQLLTVNIFL